VIAGFHAVCVPRGRHPARQPPGLPSVPSHNLGIARRLPWAVGMIVSVAIPLASLALPEISGGAAGGVAPRDGFGQSCVGAGQCAALRPGVAP
jgi:hypothetical protein